MLGNWIKPRAWIATDRRLFESTTYVYSDIPEKEKVSLRESVYVSRGNAAIVEIVNHKEKNLWSRLMNNKPIRIDLKDLREAVIDFEGHYVRKLD